MCPETCLGRLQPIQKRRACARKTLVHWRPLRFLAAWQVHEKKDRCKGSLEKWKYNGEGTIRSSESASYFAHKHKSSWRELRSTGLPGYPFAWSSYLIRLGAVAVQLDLGLHPVARLCATHLAEVRSVSRVPVVRRAFPKKPYPSVHLEPDLKGIRVWTNFKPSWQRGQKDKSCDGHKPFCTRLTFAGFLHPAASFHLPFLCASFAAPNPPDFPRSTPERVPQQELGSSSRMSVFACFLAQAESLLKTRQRVYSWGRLVPVTDPAPTEMSTSQGARKKVTRCTTIRWVPPCAPN